MGELLGERLGDFEIVRKLGRGGMGVVYEARQISLNRRVALKVLAGRFGLTAKAVQRFHREAEAAAKPVADTAAAAKAAADKLAAAQKVATDMVAVAKEADVSTLATDKLHVATGEPRDTGDWREQSVVVKLHVATSQRQANADTIGVEDHACVQVGESLDGKLRS